MMKKIKKYLESMGYELKYERYYTGKHYGGRSFYNDGTYGVDVYKIGNTNYYIHNKETGRPAFYLYKGNNLKTVRFSQTDFCNMLNDIQLN